MDVDTDAEAEQRRRLEDLDTHLAEAKVLRMEDIQAQVAEENARRLEDLHASMAEAKALREKNLRDHFQRQTEQRAKDQLRRLQVEERRFIITMQDELFKEELRLRDKERDERIGQLRASRTPPPLPEYAFGSSRPRLLETVDTSGFAWAARRAASTSDNAASAPLKRCASASQLHSDDVATDPLPPQPFVRSTFTRGTTGRVPKIVVRSPDLRGHKSGDTGPASSLYRSRSVNDRARARLRSPHETHRAGTATSKLPPLPPKPTTEMIRTAAALEKKKIRAAAAAKKECDFSMLQLPPANTQAVVPEPELIAPPPPSPLSCPYCKKVFKSLHGVKVHLGMKHKVEQKKALEENKTTQEQAAVSAAAPLQTINGNNSDENLTSGLQNNIISPQIREPKTSNGNVLVRSNPLRMPSICGHVSSAGTVRSFDLDDDEV